ncbi:MAG: type II secretion system protein GspN [Deltaproteobacteria bacterium]|nr:type II secretion system protein GspN [Deltaproteobacteria bacterium]
MNKLVVWVINISGGIFFFFLFLFLFFPFGQVLNHFISRVETETGGAYRITVGEMEPSLIFRSVFKDFKVHKMEEGKDTVILDLPEVKLGLHYLPLVSGRLNTSFVGVGKKGKMEGKVRLSKGEYSLDLDLDKISFVEIPYLSQSVKIPMEGLMKGEIGLKIYPEEVTKNEGKIDLKILQFKIPPSHLTPYSGFDLDLPETLLSGDGEGVIRVNMEKGKLEIVEINFPGEDIKLNLSGTVQLNRRFSLSRIMINGNFQLSDKLKEAFPLILVIDKQKNEDGSYPLTISGRISKPQIKVGTSDIL